MRILLTVLLVFFIACGGAAPRPADETLRITVQTEYLEGEFVSLIDTSLYYGSWAMSELIYINWNRGTFRVCSSIVLVGSLCSDEIPWKELISPTEPIIIEGSTDQ